MNWLNMNSEEAKSYKAPKSFTILGYCPQCGCILSEKDKISPRVIVCALCDKKLSVKGLRDTPKYHDKKNDDKEANKVGQFSIVEDIEEVIEEEGEYEEGDEEEGDEEEVTEDIETEKDEVVEDKGSKE